MFKLGCSLKYFNVKNILIGYDTRNSNQALLFNLSSGILASGINVIDGMVLPTSAVAYYTYIKNMVGIVITASHNSYEYNGIKIFKNGRKISYQDQEKLESLIDSKFEFDDDIEFGHYLKSLEPLNLYEKYISSFINKSNLKFAFDFANGALAQIAQKTLNKLNTKPIYYGNRPNGFNINDSGAISPKAIINIVKGNSLDYGFAYDGDGDRIVMVDKTGYIYSGDELLYIIARYLDKYHILKNKKVVLSKLANLGIINKFKESDFEVVLSDIGDSEVLKVMNNVSAVIGAEPSGHIILEDYLPTGDGLLVSIFLINILSSDPLYDYHLLKYPVIEKNYHISNNDLTTAILDNLDILNYINNFLNKYPTSGKIIFRKSGTEPLLRLYISHEDSSILDKTFIDLDSMIKNNLDC